MVSVNLVVCPFPWCPPSFFLSVGDAEGSFLFTHSISFVRPLCVFSDSSFMSVCLSAVHAYIAQILFNPAAGRPTIARVQELFSSPGTPEFFQIPTL